MDSNVPPPVLERARVVEYAAVDDTVKFTGALHLFVGGERLGPVPQLAICQDLDDGELLLFHCDNDWNVLGHQAWNSPHGPTLSSVQDVKDRAERFYAGISSHWVGHPASMDEARAFYEDLMASDGCSFCGRTLHDLHSLIKGAQDARICDHCIREFHALLTEPKPGA